MSALHTLLIAWSGWRRSCPTVLLLTAFALLLIALVLLVTTSARLLTALVLMLTALVLRSLHFCSCCQTFITAVAQVGVDINAIAANPWRQAPLQFVPGLGPRKAKALIKAIAANENHVKTRVDLLKPVGTSSTCSTCNCLGTYSWR